MKTIGLIGGMSPESSLLYYDIINKLTRERLGGSHSAKCILYSVDFGEVEKLQHEGNWQALNEMMAEAASNLEKSGADFILLCTNTMHLCKEAIITNTSIPFLHIAEAAGEQIRNKQLKKVALLGTRFTMEKDFYKAVLKDQFNLEVIIPDEQERTTVHKIIYEELVNGQVLNTSREKYIGIIKKLEEKGAEGVILGCTEIPMLISNNDVNIPVFDTTRIHAATAVDWALEKT